MAPLFQLPTSGLLQLCYRATTGPNQAVESVQPFSHIDHTTHGTELSCKKCQMFYETYIDLNPTQTQLLTCETQTQSHSQMWHDARMLRLTASTAKKVPKRLKTDPEKFIREHLYPTFMGNTATRAGQAYEEKAIQMLEERGNLVERKGLILHPEHPWFGASPDGVLNQKQLVEVKSPQGSLTEFLQRPRGDVRPLHDGPMDGGQFHLALNGQGGYYQQIQLTMLCTGLESCKLLIWTPSESLELDVPFDKDYAEKEMHRLQGFYFMHMLPRLVDDFLARKIKLCLRYLELVKS
ncbi:uncharacterized protein LOC121640735 [Melanotaenia boesemani]|uniref:uncharacterized protein LOC121640735 n=1 Tax=Melanotaenia boesemani TaxID=1250792 RepID=UPI001C05326D|nr:uncharacterized protein LOC121640735 [Melanotaenia boesemani]